MSKGDQVDSMVLCVGIVFKYRFHAVYLDKDEGAVVYLNKNEGTD